jgi:hypothetical protein
MNLSDVMKIRDQWFLYGEGLFLREKDQVINGRRFFREEDCSVSSRSVLRQPGKPSRPRVLLIVDEF